ncbi:hypothetical protein Cni_G19288 [Canna indica]|uniref:Lipoyl-binding domain-containing protein n=1 Tax=Canna indica TaxID=4628 RepID=A0AAQ3QID8_9LILI|nr:hypothetical protein Cni_G19288 [Canna indica]
MSLDLFGIFEINYCMKNKRLPSANNVVMCILARIFQNDHDPSKLVAETPCKLLRFLVSDGAHVEIDTPYAEVEVMKMCMLLLLSASGVIHFVMSEGEAMQAGDLISRLDLDYPSAVRRAKPFHGTFPTLGPPIAVSGKVHQRCVASLNDARMILAGYEHNINEVGLLYRELIPCSEQMQHPAAGLVLMIFIPIDCHFSILLFVVDR